MPRGPGGGRRPLPTAMKKLRGNPGKRTLNRAEPDFPVGEPDMPAILSAAAQDEWKSLVPQLAVVGLRRIDGKALAAYCVCYSRWLEAEALITQIGLLVAEKIVVGDKVVGQKVRRNPAVSIANDAMKLMKSFLVEFGMTPAARSRLLTGGEPSAKDPFEEYLAAGRKQNEQTSVN